MQATRRTPVLPMIAALAVTLAAGSAALAGGGRSQAARPRARTAKPRANALIRTRAATENMQGKGTETHKVGDLHLTADAMKMLGIKKRGDKMSSRKHELTRERVAEAFGDKVEWAMGADGWGLKAKGNQRQKDLQAGLDSLAASLEPSPAADVRSRPSTERRQRAKREKARRERTETVEVSVAGLEGMLGEDAVARPKNAKRTETPSKATESPVTAAVKEPAGRVKNDPAESAPEYGVQLKKSVEAAGLMNEALALAEDTHRSSAERLESARTAMSHMEQGLNADAATFELQAARKEAKIPTVKAGMPNRRALSKRADKLKKEANYLKTLAKNYREEARKLAGKSKRAKEAETALNDIDRVMARSKRYLERWAPESLKEAMKLPDEGSKATASEATDRVGNHQQERLSSHIATFEPIDQDIRSSEEPPVGGAAVGAVANLAATEDLAPEDLPEALVEAFAARENNGNWFTRRFSATKRKNNRIWNERSRQLNELLTANAANFVGLVKYLRASPEALIGAIKGLRDQGAKLDPKVLDASKALAERSMAGEPVVETTVTAGE